MAPYCVILADDHVMFRQGIKRIVEEIDDIEVIGEVSDGLELLDFMKKSKPDMVILDISMPNLRGIEATSEINTIYPDVKVLILTMHNNKEYLYQALSAGAAGYLLKQDADTDLISAIETIRQGKKLISPALSSDLANDLVKTNTKGLIRPPFDFLTTREREVLKLIAEGKTNKKIADLLFISVRTVEHHRSNIMNKLGFKKVAELVKYAISKGYTAGIP